MKIIMSWSNGLDVATIDRIYDPEKDGVTIVFANEEEKRTFIAQLSEMNTSHLSYFRCPARWKTTHARKAFALSKKAIAVHKAREAGVCRICSGKMDGSFILDFGREFAHDKCLIEEERQKKTKRTSRKSK